MSFDFSNYYTRSVKAAIFYFQYFIVSIGLKQFYNCVFYLAFDTKCYRRFQNFQTITAMFWKGCSYFQIELCGFLFLYYFAFRDFYLRVDITVSELNRYSLEILKPAVALRAEDTDWKHNYKKLWLLKWNDFDLKSEFSDPSRLNSPGSRELE